MKKKLKKTKIILGIETSCDDTCISLLKGTIQNEKIEKIEIIENKISSQIKIHEKYGGVYPSLAKREHEKNLSLIFNKIIKKNKIDYIAVTVGPGLDPCLWTGINFAEKIKKTFKAPIIPINHIEAHLIISFFSLKEKFLFLNKDVYLPAIGLIASGGHTILTLIKKINCYKIIGSTRDDAAGECFDKTARILGLGYPGGPAISLKSKEWKKRNLNSKIKLPRPMIHSKNFDFSFSGLKTAVLYNYQATPTKTKKSEKYIEEMANEIQDSINDVLIKKTLAAVEKYKAKSIILGGGVTSNKSLQNRFKKESKEVKTFFPPGKLQMDNAVMIAVAGFYKKPLIMKKIKASPNLKL